METLGPGNARFWDGNAGMWHGNDRIWHGDAGIGDGNARIWYQCRLAKTFPAVYSWFAGFHGGPGPAGICLQCRFAWKTVAVEAYGAPGFGLGFKISVSIVQIARIPWNRRVRADTPEFSWSSDTGGQRERGKKRVSEVMCQHSQAGSIWVPQRVCGQPCTCDSSVGPQSSSAGTSPLASASGHCHRCGDARQTVCSGPQAPSLLPEPPCGGV